MVTPGMRPAGWTWFVLFGVFLTANAHFLSGRAYIPYDSTDQFFPQTLFVVRSLLRGDAPWWNPLVFSGIPVLGDPQSMIFTPHTLIGLLAGHSFGQMTFDLTTLSCLLVGAGALLVYGRRIGGTPAVGLLGAVLFMLGGVATSRLQHVIQVISYATLPVVLLAVQNLCLRPGVGRAFLLMMTSLILVLNPSRLPSFSDSRESIVEDRLLGEHHGEALDERGQLLIGHVRHEVVEHSALAKQRMGAALCGI